MIKVVNSSQMRGIDERTIREMKIPGLILMENAGSAVLTAFMEKYRDPKGVSVSVFCGKGNNGGDGFVIARRLMNIGANVTVFLAAEKGAVMGDAAVNLFAFEAMGGVIKEITDGQRLTNHKIKFMHSAVMVDALLGTGLSRAPSGIVADIIKMINKSGAYKIAVDVPSGVDSDLGKIMGDSVSADITITFGLPKVGLLTYPAAKKTGSMVIADISIPTTVIEESPCSALLLESDDIFDNLPVREPDANKGRFGHLALACGSVGMGGTAIMAGLAALRVGTGLVTAACPESLCGAYETSTPEMMTFVLPQTASGAIDEDAADKFISMAKGKAAVLAGPGLRTDDSTSRFVRSICRNLRCPMVIDADALNIIGRNVSILKERQAPTIITPHPGEMARLTGTSVEDVQENRLEAAQSYAQQSGAVVVLKGAGTVIAGPGQTPRISLTGNHGLATGGSGDVLSGMIAGFLSQGVSAMASAEMGVWLHGRCADLYADENDPRTLIPSDIIGLIPKAITNILRENC